MLDCAPRFKPCDFWRNRHEFAIRRQRDGDMMGYLVILLKRQPFLSRIG